MKRYLTDDAKIDATSHENCQADCVCGEIDKKQRRCSVR